MQEPASWFSQQALQGRIPGPWLTQDLGVSQLRWLLGFGGGVAAGEGLRSPEESATLIIPFLSIRGERPGLEGVTCCVLLAWEK